MKSHHAVRHALLLCVIATTALTAQQTSDAPRRPPEISTSGTATIPVTVDLATITFGFTERGRTPRAAGALAAAKATAIRDALVAVGIPRDSLPNVTQGWWWGARSSVDVTPTTRDTSYVTTEVFTARIRDLALVGRAIDAALEQGAQRIDAVQFTATRTDAAEERALEEATRQAAARAARMADAAGGRLGRLLELTTNASRGHDEDFVTYTGKGLESSDDATRIVVPALQVRMTVYGRWEFLPR